MHIIAHVIRSCPRENAMQNYGTNCPTLHNCIHYHCTGTIQ